MSEEGQKLYRDAEYLPVDPAVPPKDPALRPGDGTFKAVFMTPEQIFDDLPKWGAIYKDVFR